MVLSAPIFNIT